MVVALVQPVGGGPPEHPHGQPRLARGWRGPGPTFSVADREVPAREVLEAVRVDRAPGVPGVQGPALRRLVDAVLQPLGRDHRRLGRIWVVRGLGDALGDRVTRHEVLAVVLWCQVQLERSGGAGDTPAHGLDQQPSDGSGNEQSHHHGGRQAEVANSFGRRASGTCGTRGPRLTRLHGPSCTAVPGGGLVQGVDPEGPLHEPGQRDRQEPEECEQHGGDDMTDRAAEPGSCPVDRTAAEAAEQREGERDGVGDERSHERVAGGRGVCSDQGEYRDRQPRTRTGGRKERGPRRRTCDPGCQRQTDQGPDGGETQFAGAPRPCSWGGEHCERHGCCRPPSPRPLFGDGGWHLCPGRGRGHRRASAISSSRGRTDPKRRAATNLAPVSSWWASST